MSDLPINTRRRQSYLPPVSIPTLSMIGKPVQIHARVREDARKGNSFTAHFHHTWAGTLEWFRIEHDGSFLTFHIVGDPNAVVIDMKKHDIEVTA